MSASRPTLDRIDRPDKRFHTACAKMALAGGSLVQGEDDRGETVYHLTRWHLTRTLRDMDAVEAFIDRMGGPGGAG